MEGFYSLNKFSPPAIENQIKLTTSPCFLGFYQMQKLN